MGAADQLSGQFSLFPDPGGPTGEEHALARENLHPIPKVYAENGFTSHPNTQKNRNTTRIREAAIAPTMSRHDMSNVPSILEHGMLSQHETGTSTAFFGPEERGISEGRVFPDNPYSQPTYGYQGTSDQQAAHYGTARFTMKPHMREHTTLTNTDSLGASPEALEVTELRGASQAPPSNIDRDLNWDYVESQMHHTPQAGDVAKVDLDITNLMAGKRMTATNQRTLRSWEGGAEHTPEQSDRMRRMIENDTATIARGNDEVGTAMNAAHAHGVPVSVMREERYRQGALSDRADEHGRPGLTGVDPHQYGDMGESQLSVRQTPKWVSENLGSDFVVGPHTDSARNAPVVYTGGSADKIRPKLNVPGWHGEDDEYDDDEDGWRF